MLVDGVHESGYREVIAIDVGEAETDAFWRSFLRGLVERGLSGVRVVVSDAHAGLKKAIRQVLGCPWQRCTSTSFVKRSATPAASSNRCSQRCSARSSTPTAARSPGNSSARRSNGSANHCRRSRNCSKGPRKTRSPSTPFRPTTGRSYSTNPLERVNREIGRRTDVVGIFPNDRSLIRLAASLVIEQNDEWLVGRRYLSNHSLEAVVDQDNKEDKDREEMRELTAA